MAAIALFLTSNEDRLAEFRGFPRHSAYNEAEKAMGLLNIAWSGCGFKFPDNLPSWFKAYYLLIQPCLQYEKK